MRPKKETHSEETPTVSEQSDILWPVPQTELGAKLIALAKEINESNLPKLSVEEIEEHLGREIGGIAAAYGDASRN
ncbi:MAG: hypothetical protein AB7P14_11385 [Blastocatellales bacterium]